MIFFGFIRNLSCRVNWILKFGEMKVFRETQLRFVELVKNRSCWNRKLVGIFKWLF